MALSPMSLGAPALANMLNAGGIAQGAGAAGTAMGALQAPGVAAAAAPAAGAAFDPSQLVQNNKLQALAQMLGTLGGALAPQNTWQSQLGSAVADMAFQQKAINDKKLQAGQILEAVRQGRAANLNPNGTPNLQPAGSDLFKNTLAGMFGNTAPQQHPLAR